MFYDDDGAAIRRARRAPHIWANHRRVTLDRFQVYVQVGAGATAGQGSQPLVMMRYSVDGGSTWSNELFGDLGERGQYGIDVECRALGQGEDWVFELASSEPIPHMWFGQRSMRRAILTEATLTRSGQEWRRCFPTTGHVVMDRWNLQVEAGRVEEVSELLDEILKITASELPEESAEE